MNRDYLGDLSNSEAFQNLTVAKDMVSNLDRTSDEGAETANLIDRLDAVTDYALARLTATEGLLATRHMLSVLHSRTETLLEDITKLRKGDQSLDHSAVDRSLDGLLDEVVKLPKMVERTDSEVAAAVVVQVKRIGALGDSLEHSLESARKQLNEINEIRDRALERVVQIDVSAIKEQYDNASSHQLKIAKRWHWGGVGILVLLVVVAGLSYFGWFGALASQNESEVAAVMAGYGLPAALVLLATVFLGRSRNYRRTGEDAGRVSAELALFWDVTERLPPDQRKALTADILPRYFGGASGQSAHSARSDALDGIARLVERARTGEASENPV